ncbi:MAG: hypothetical protein RIA64_05020 [Rhodospirillales bacterium]
MAAISKGHRALREVIRTHIGVLIAVLLAVAACTPLPRAFQPGEVESVGEAIVHGTFTKGIQVNPVEGAAPIMSKILARTTVDSFEPYGLPAGVAPFDASEYVLHGRAHRDKNPNAIPYVTIHWQLSNREGLLLADLEQPVDATGDEWEFGTPEVIIRVAEDVAHRVAAILAGIAPAQEAPAPDKGIFVMPVEGAPGDGDFSLTRAIAEALKARGTRLTRYREQAKYVLTGLMKVSPSVQGRQGVRITWRLSRPDGKEVGKAEQENTVPSGTFDTQWMPTARLIAMAAVDGIHEVISGWEDRERLLAQGGGLGLPENLEEGALPKPGGPKKVIAKMEDHLVPPDAPVSEDGPAEKSASEALAAARPGASGNTPPPAEQKSVLGPEDAGGEQIIDDTFKPPTLPMASDDGANSFLVAEVTGAPGNGNRLLGEALRRVLRARDQNVTEDPRQARYLVRGLVVMSTPKAGKQDARIVWSVENADGTPLGSAEQHSAVNAGALDDNWGDTALDVAMGAVVGIQRVLGDKARPFVRRLPSDEPTSPAESTETLQWAPGEAIPPPTR